MDCLFVPVSDGNRWGVYPIKSEVGRNTCGEVADRRVIVGDATQGYILFELGDVIGEG
jgi:hypothetical protein